MIDVTSSSFRYLELSSERFESDGAKVFAENSIACSLYFIHLLSYIRMLLASMSIVQHLIYLALSSPLLHHVISNNMFSGNEHIWHGSLTCNF
jgi:hypothetical protein